MTLTEIRKAVIGHTGIDPLQKTRKREYVKARVIFNEIAKRFYIQRQIGNFLSIERSVMCHYNNLALEVGFLSEKDCYFCDNGFMKYRSFIWNNQNRNNTWHRVGFGF